MSEANRVRVGMAAKVRWIETGEEEEFQLVSAGGTSIPENKLAADTPLGRTLLGAQQGDTLTLEAPGGPTRVEIVAVHD